MEQRKIIGKDYTDKLENTQEEQEPDKKKVAAMLQILLQHDNRIKRLPHFIDPLAAAAFEDLAGDCDRMMKDFSGRWKAVIDFESYEAYIEIECVYLEFCTGEFMSTLQKLSTRSIHVFLAPLTSGFLRIHILMPYFIPMEKSPPTAESP